MPDFWREKTLLIKEEVTYAVDPTPTGAANAILATDLKIMPMEGQDVSRELEMPWMGGQATIPAGLFAKMTFKVELKGSGTAGTSPAFGPLLKACAMAEVIVASTSVTYNRVTTGHKSCTIYFNVGGKLYKLRGARGNAVIKMDAQGIVYIEFEFWGLYDAPTAQAAPTPTLASQLTAIPQIATSANTPTFTIGGTSHILRSLGLNFGNKVEPRLLIRSESIIISDFSEIIDLTIEAVALATYDPYALALAATTQALSLVHGVGAGKICTLSVPRAQVQRPAAMEVLQGIVEWPLKYVPLPNTGNDQLTLAFT